jgi:hypothetical protein
MFSTKGICTMGTVSTTIGRKRLGLAMAAFCLWAGLGTAHAGGTLWYTGDPDNFNAIYNTINPATGNGIVYDTFVVPNGDTWTITGVFSNDFMNYTSSSLTAYFAIRSDVSNGRGGRLVDSGTDLASQQANGGSFAGYNGYTVSVSGLNITLGPGTYSLAVVPVAISSDDFSYIGTTSGANHQGPRRKAGDTFVAGRYYTSNFPGSYNYWPASNVTLGANGRSPVFSMGIQSVPEPSTLVMGVIGTLTMLGNAWRSRRLRAR